MNRLAKPCCNRRALGLVLFLLAAAGLAVPAYGQFASQLEAARECSQETRRLERLACFDAVFGTPVSVTPETHRETQRPERWRQAFAQELRRRPGDGPLYRDTGELSGHLITLAALGTQPPRPVLAVQCHNNITELSLLLPEPIQAERIRLALGNTQGGGQQLWRVRDNGYVLSGGRGLPAIRTTRELASQVEARITSANSAIDGLMFDLGGLREILKPLRNACGW